MKVKFQQTLKTLVSIAILSGPTALSAQEFMSKDELLATIPGGTLFGISSSDNKTQWAQAYGKGKKRGKISGVYGTDKYTAKWSIKGDLWCENWGSGSGCWAIERVDAKTLQAYKESGEKLRNQWKIK